MNLIESHVHVWTVSDPRYPAHPEAAARRHDDHPADDLFAAQRSIGGVAWTVLIQPSHYMWDNEYLAQAALDHPDKFVVAGRIDPRLPDAPTQLRELMQRPGYRGLRLAANESPEDHWLDHHSQDALWEAAAEEHATMGLLINWYQLPQAEEMAQRHPDVTIVIDHLGRPDYQDPRSLDNLIALAEQPSIHVKLSGYPHGSGDSFPYAETHAFIERAFRAYGAERLMWGTDWPVCLDAATYEQAYRSAWELEFLSDDDRAWIFENTARKAWRIPA